MREIWRCKKKWQYWRIVRASKNQIYYKLIMLDINISFRPEWIETVDIFKWDILVSQLWNRLLHRPPIEQINSWYVHRSNSRPMTSYWFHANNESTLKYNLVQFFQNDIQPTMFSAHFLASAQYMTRVKFPEKCRSLY